MYQGLLSYSPAWLELLHMCFILCVYSVLDNYTSLMSACASVGCDEMLVSKCVSQLLDYGATVDLYDRSCEAFYVKLEEVLSKTMMFCYMCSA